MSQKYDGEVILVTGAGSGIGEATAVKLASEGAQVAILDLNEDEAQRVANGILATGGSAISLQINVSNRADWERVTAEVRKSYGRIDGLVNNAGVTRDKTMKNMTDADWDLVMDVNLKGSWLGAQHVLPYLREVGGNIVNLSSESRYGEFGQANYASAKAGVMGLTRTLAIEFAKYNIRCNAIAPGSTDTPMTRAVPQEIRDSWLDDIPLKRLAKPEEIASAISFLLSSESSYITGQIIGVDGGSAR